MEPARRRRRVLRSLSPRCERPECSVRRAPAPDELQASVGATTRSPCRLHGLLPASPHGPRELRHARRPRTVEEERARPTRLLVVAGRHPASAEPDARVSSGATSDTWTRRRSLERAKAGVRCWRRGMTGGVRMQGGEGAAKLSTTATRRGLPPRVPIAPDLCGRRRRKPCRPCAGKARWRLGAPRPRRRGARRGPARPRGG